MRDPDDLIESLLKQRRITPVRDGGFTERLLDRLPHRVTARRWIVPALTLLGLLIALPTLREPRAPASLAQLTGSINVLAALAAAGLLSWSACLWALIAYRDSRI